MDDYIMITVFENTLVAQRIVAMLSVYSFPPRFSSVLVTGYEGVFLFLEGWGELYAPLKLKSEILKIIEIVRSE